VFLGVRPVEVLRDAGGLEEEVARVFELVAQKRKIAFVLTAILTLAGCTGTADRLLMVKGDVQTAVGAADDCIVRFVGAPGKVLYEERMTKTGQAGFTNPPALGQFFVDVVCGQRTARHGPYLFERDHKIDLGKVTPR
jgi:hypothetical protein